MKSRLFEPSAFSKPPNLRTKSSDSLRFALVRISPPIFRTKFSFRRRFEKSVFHFLPAGIVCMKAVFLCARAKVWQRSCKRTLLLPVFSQYSSHFATTQTNPSRNTGHTVFQNNRYLIISKKCVVTPNFLFAFQ